MEESAGTDYSGCFHFVPALCAKLLQSCLTLCDPVDCSLLCLWDSSGKNKGVGCYALIQGRQGSRQANIAEACDLEGLCASVAVFLPTAALLPSRDNTECGF